ncbi:complement factor B-like [Branchiostoma floridae x Branchiostoma belcheri]
MLKSRNRAIWHTAKFSSLLYKIYPIYNTSTSLSPVVHSLHRGCFADSTAAVPARSDEMLATLLLFSVLVAPYGGLGAGQAEQDLQCPSLRSPENGRRVGTTTTVGSTVHFSCFSGYTLYGSPQRICREDGTWNGTDTTCDDERSDCPVLPTPVNGRKTGNGYNRYDVITFHCNPGYEMLGSRKRKCLRSGEWSGENTRCLGRNEFDSVPDVAANFGMGLDALAHASCSSQVDTNNRDQCRGSRARFLNTNNPHGLDLYFVFDASGSVGYHHYNASVNFAKALIQKVGVSTLPGGTRVGAIAFASQTKVLFRTLEALSVREALGYLDNTKWSDLSEEINTGSNTRQGLTFLRNMIIANKQASPERKAKQAVILITDGVHNMGGDPSVEAEKLREEEDVEMFCIGVGKDIVKFQLQKIASDPPREHFFVLKDYLTLEWLISNMTNNNIDYSLCGVSGRTTPPIQGKIIGGVTARPGAWPWQAAIFVGRSVRKSKFHCGGVLVDREWVMSTAHCFPPDRNITEFRIYLGLLARSEKDLGNEVQDFGLRELHVHPGYGHDRLDFDYDIAMIRLSRHVTLGPYVRTACLPGDIKDEEFRRESAGYVTGWGVTSSRSWRHAKVLQQVRLPVRSDGECLREIRDHSKSGQALSYTDRMFCAGHRSRDRGGPRDACRGDSGGPFVVKHVKKEDRSQRWVLSGLVSWGVSPVCDGRGYGFYTNVTSLMAWVRGVLPTESTTAAPVSADSSTFPTVPTDLTTASYTYEPVKSSTPQKDVTTTTTTTTTTTATTTATTTTTPPTNPPTTAEPRDRRADITDCGVVPKRLGGRTRGLRFPAGLVPVGGRDRPRSRIYGGTDSKKGAWPWQTALFLKTEQGNNKYFCGASLLKARWVVTAAHCITGEVYRQGNIDTDIVVGLGLTERSLPGTSKTAHAQYIPVRKAYIHGDYDRFSDVFDYDIALLELRDAAVLGPWVRPVCLPANVRQGLRMSEEGTTGTVVGWGRLGDGATPTAQILQQISLPVQPHGTCERAMEAAGRPTAQYTSRMFCAGDVAGGRDACPGDSGGPFMVSRKSGGTDRWHLVGVVSTGTDQGCGRPGQLGLYTMVAKYLDWIHSIIN